MTIWGLGSECNQSWYKQTKGKDLYSMLGMGREVSLSLYFAGHAPGNTWLTDTGSHLGITRDIMLQIKKTLKKAEDRH